MTKILQIGDLHMADNAPTGRSDNYLETCLDKLAQVVDYANTINPDVIVFMGDIFHVKRPSANSHYLVNRINALLHHLPRKPFVILGNHDTPTEGQAFHYYPLASLDMEILLEPVTTEGVTLIPIGGAIGKLQDNLRTYVEQSAAWAPGVPVVIAHLAISSTPLQFDYVSSTLFAGLVPIVLFGHLHYRDIFEQEGTLFCNPGAMMRTSISETDFNLEPAVAVIDVQTHEVTLRKLKFKPASEVMHLEIYAEKKEEAFARSQFADLLSQSTIAVAGKEAIVQQIKQASVPDRVKDVAVDLLENV